MQTNQTNTAAVPILSAVGTRARLRSRVSRMPASLGGYHYYLYPGQLVYITGHAGGIPRCSVIEDSAERSSEDYFSVSYEDLDVIEAEPKAAPYTMHVFRKQEHEREMVWIYKGEVDVETKETTFGELLPSDRVSNYFPEENYECEEMPEAGGMICSI